ncbi:MAG: DinB family protein [Candidatus Rokubacteria bacterium]|nr:DinB family protein [Candidatus Rokubacteria bacterium]
MLSSLGVAFEPVNVDATPAALAELGRLGVPRVPAVAVGERVVHGWNPKGVAELVGVEYAEPVRLQPVELIDRLDRILAAAQRAIRQVPAERLETKPPERDRTVRDLGYHIFRLSVAFPLAVEQNRLPEEWLTEPVPRSLRDGEAIARYGEGVRARLKEWYHEAPAESFEWTVETYHGSQTVWGLLERTAWHAAQHLRQLYALLETVGIAPDRPLTGADFQGLPLPEALW